MIFNKFTVILFFLQKHIVNTESGKKRAVVRLHRGKVYEEFMRILKNDMIKMDEAIQIQMLSPDGKRERAQDVGGVFRDAISEFWSTFYERCTLGTTNKLPEIRHDIYESEWKAVGKAFLFSWKKECYFPIKLPPTFIKMCLGVKNDGEDLLKDFMLYLDEDERNLLTRAIADFNSVEVVDLMGVLSKFGNTSIPNMENIKCIIINIAHIYLIQKPSFISECFGMYLKGVLRITDLALIYRELVPTAQNIIKNFNFQDATSTEAHNTRRYLLTFIQESSEDIRRAFLRFCTGSDVVTGEIRIGFKSFENIFSRRPVAHTCSQLLLLPISYENFKDFSTELNNILSSNIWIMDMV